MPEMAIPRQFWTNPVTAFNVGHVILSYMTFPSDEESRQKFIKASNQLVMNELRAHSKTLVEKYSDHFPKHVLETERNKIVNTEVKQHLILADDPETFLTEINAQDMINKFLTAEMQKDWKTVTSIVQTLLKIRKAAPNIKGGVSLTKAVSFLEKCLDKGLLPQAGHIHANGSDMKAAWAKYKSVAHLTMVFYKMWANPEGAPDINFLTQNGVKNFVILAANLQGALLSFNTQHGHKSHIIKGDEMWLIPSYFQVQTVPIKVDDMSTEQMTILNSYRHGD